MFSFHTLARKALSWLLLLFQNIMGGGGLETIFSYNHDWIAYEKKVVLW